MPSFSFVLFLFSALTTVQAFSPAATPSLRPPLAATTIVAADAARCCKLHMSSGEGGAEEPQGEQAPEEQEHQRKEDPELKALKEEIAALEKTFGEKKSALEYALEQCEEYSKTGYARKVAEMENMRRVRSNIASTSQSSAISAVLRDFMPAYDKLNSLNEKYDGDEFGSQYRELNLQSTFAKLGVTDYNVTPGEKVNNFRMKVLESEISKDFAKDTVIREVSSGLELDGNVIRAASCVASLGSGEEEAGDSKGEAAPEE